jgi:colanic acid biosynthesis glycosyl transferase WcaI
MNVALVDYSGHAFSVQLSRELARRGHNVLHLYFLEFPSPKGRLTIGADDPPTLVIEAVSLAKPFAKYSYAQRLLQEHAVGRAFAKRVSAFCPDVVIGCNLPLDTLQIIAKAAKRRNAAFVFWQQDIYSDAIERILGKKFGWIGTAIGYRYKSLERSVLRLSDVIVAISEDFVTYDHNEFGIQKTGLHVVENWAPLAEIPMRPKDNAWSRAHGLNDKNVVLYTGTLGMKHDPGLILAAAEALRHRSDTVVVVASDGPTADGLKRQAAERTLDTLRVIGFQSFGDYPDVLGSGDVLISILEADAGVFSVPSKTLSYLCAGRALVLSAPASNLASRIVSGNGAGKNVDSGDSAGFIAAIEHFLDNPTACQQAGRNGRAYAEKTFDIAAIGDRFETILDSARRVAAGR